MEVTLVAGLDVFICDECVQLCQGQGIIVKKAATQASTEEVPGSPLPWGRRRSRKTRYSRAAGRSQSLSHRRGTVTRIDRLTIGGQREEIPDNEPTETLLKSLAGYNGAFGRIAAGMRMQDIVDVLREREVTWATIGQALTVSRQAAWKRFSSKAATANPRSKKRSGRKP